MTDDTSSAVLVSSRCAARRSQPLSMAAASLRMAASCCSRWPTRRLGIAERLARCFPDRRDPSADHPHARRHDPRPRLRDLLRLRGRRRSGSSAHRSGVQARLRASARQRLGPVFAADAVAAGERAVAEGRDPPHLCACRPMDGVLRTRAGVGHARYRRHLRCRARPSAAVAVQRPL